MPPGPKISMPVVPVRYQTNDSTGGACFFDPINIVLLCVHAQNICAKPAGMVLLPVVYISTLGTVCHTCYLNSVIEELNMSQARN